MKKHNNIKVGGHESPQPEVLPKPKILPQEPGAPGLPDEDEVWGVPEPKVIPKPKA